MGTSAFEQAWGNSPAPDALDAAWGSTPSHKPLTKVQLDRLAKNQADKNAADAVTAGDYLDVPRQTLGTVMSGIPGVNLARSAVQSFATKRPLADVQGEVNAETSDVPYASAAGKMLGGMAMLPVLPASGAVSGAAIGALDQLLNNDPNSSIGGRIARGVAGGVGGGLLGHYTDRAITSGRALVSLPADVARNRMLADRAKEAKSLFNQALAEGQGKMETQPILNFLASEDIAPIVADLKSTRPYANVDEFSPEMLDAVYKVLSDKGQMAKGKLAALVPRNANLGRVAAKDIGMAKDEALTAMSRAPDAPMPTYETAVKSFADKSRNIDSFDTGINALRSEMSGTLPAAKNLSRPEKSSASFADWLTSPQDAENAATGILSGVRKVKSRKAADAATVLLRAADKARGNQVPNITQKGLLAAQRAGLSGLLGYLSPNQ